MSLHQIWNVHVHVSKYMFPSPLEFWPSNRHNFKNLSSKSSSSNSVLIFIDLRGLRQKAKTEQEGGDESAQCRRWLKRTLFSQWLVKQGNEMKWVHKSVRNRELRRESCSLGLRKGRRMDIPRNSIPFCNLNGLLPNTRLWKVERREQKKCFLCGESR